MIFQRKDVDNKIDDVTSKLESDIDLSIDTSVSINVGLEAKITQLQQIRDGLRDEYDALCQRSGVEIKEKFLDKKEGLVFHFLRSD